MVVGYEIQLLIFINQNNLFVIDSVVDVDHNIRTGLDLSLRLEM